MKTPYTVSMLRMLAYYIQTPVLGREDEARTFSYHTQVGSMISSARESFVRDVLELDSTHLLFVDEDMGFAPWVLNTLLMRQMPFVGCNYLMKRWPKQFTARKVTDDGWIETNAETDSLEECLFMGMGMTLIETDILKNMKAPNFLMDWSEEWKTYATEDRYLCLKMREAGYPPYIDHKASKLVYHVGDHPYSWDNTGEPQKQPYGERVRIKQNG